MSRIEILERTMPAVNTMIAGRDPYRFRELFSQDELASFVGRGAWLVDAKEGCLAIGDDLRPPCVEADQDQRAPHCQGCIKSAQGSETFRCDRNNNEFWCHPIAVGGRTIAFLAHAKSDDVTANPLSDRASLLCSTVWSRWRERLVHDAVLSLSECKTEQRAFAIAGRAASLLFGSDTVSHAYQSVAAGAITLLWAHSPHASLPTHPASPSHIGHSIAAEISLYEPDVRDPIYEHLRFHFVSEGEQTRTAFTVFLYLTADRRAAFQVLSDQVDAFAEPERDAFMSVIRVLSATIRCLSRDSFVRLADPATEPWTRTILRVLLDDSEQLTLGARRDLYEAVAREAMRLGHCYNAAVRLTSGLMYAACVGDGWNDALKDRIFHCDSGQSVGGQAFTTGQVVYIHDYAQQSRFTPVGDIQSICVLPFTLGGAVAGVISLSWLTTNGLGTPDTLTDAITPLKQLVVELEHVLSTLIEKEDLAFRGVLDRIVVDGEPMAVFEQQLIERFRHLFNVRGCSLFLRLPGDDALTLVASTHLPTEQPTSARSDSMVDTCGREGWSNRQPDLLLVPVSDSVHCLGVIRLEGKITGDPFTHEDEFYLKANGLRLARALQTLWRDELAREREQTLKLLLTVHDPDLAALTTSIVDAASKLTGADAAKLVVLDRNGDPTSIKGALQLRRRDADIPWAQLIHGQERICLPRQSDGSGLCEDLLGRFEAGGPSWSLLWAPFKVSESGIVQGLEGVLLLAWHDEDGPSRSQGGIPQLLTWIEGILPAAIRVERVIHELETLRSIGLQVGSQDLKAVLGTILSECIRWLGLEAGAIRVYEPVRNVWIGLAASLTEAEFPIALSNHAFLEQTRDWPEAIRLLPSLEHNEEWEQYLATLTDRRVLEHFRSRKSLVHVPIRNQGVCVGYIALSSPKAMDISEDEARYLQIHASYCALAIDLETKRKKLEQEMTLSAPLALLGAMLTGFLHEFRGSFQRLANVAFAVNEMADDPAFVRDGCNRLTSVLARLTAVSRDLHIFAKVGYQERIVLRDLLERVFLSHVGNIDVDIASTGDPAPVIDGNPVQIEMAFRMLYDNAVEAMPDGGRLEVRSWADGPSVTVTVADTGVGMDDDTLERCWTPHFSTKRDDEGLAIGTGLGLSVVQGIIVRHGGRIAVRSRKGEGTTFTIDFPNEGHANVA